MYLSPQARLAIYAEGEFGKGQSKTAEGVIRYGRNPIAAVIDSTESGKTVKQSVGIECSAPVVSSIDDSLKYNPDALLLGIAPTGGKLPPAWRNDIIKAISSGMDVVNGLHDFLGDDAEIAEVARHHGKAIYDVRKPPENLPVGTGRALSVDSYVVLTVGTDSSVGKMTASLELEKEAIKRGKQAVFVATGQTGIMICGKGIAIDRVIGDFMAGATEQMVLEAALEKPNYIFVEGQGSLAHPGFSGVTLALMHGACPKAMVLVHKATKTKIGKLNFPIPSLTRTIDVSESMARFVRPCPVVAVAVNTWGLDEDAARKIVESAERETGLPSTDPVRWGPGPIMDAIQKQEEKDK